MKNYTKVKTSKSIYWVASEHVLDCLDMDKIFAISDFIYDIGSASISKCTSGTNSLTGVGIIEEIIRLRSEVEMLKPLNRSFGNK